MFLFSAAEYLIVTAQSKYRSDMDNDHGDMCAKGEHYFCGDIEGQPKWMVFGCRNPGNNKSGLCQIALRPHQKNSVGASWEFDGNREAPTISPSVNCEKVCGWHGHIQAGRYKPE